MYRTVGPLEALRFMNRSLTMANCSIQGLRAPWVSIRDHATYMLFAPRMPSQMPGRFIHRVLITICSIPITPTISLQCLILIPPLLALAVPLQNCLVL